MPQITFKSLAYTDIQTLLKCFNESFKKYYLPQQLTKEQFADKLYAEAIDLKLSFGAFDNNSLVAFILNGIDTLNNKTLAYNAGTGVLPEYRGRRLSFSLYEYCLSCLKNSGIEKCVLEVIDRNFVAIKTYERNGFTSTRKLISYIGIAECDKTSTIDIKANIQPDWDIVDEMCEWERSWQYNNNTLKRSWDNYSMITAFSGDGAEAFCIANLKNGRVGNFGSKNKNTKYLAPLFAYLGQNTKSPLTIINVDEMAVTSNSFITSIGLEVFYAACTMEKDL